MLAALLVTACASNNAQQAPNRQAGGVPPQMQGRMIVQPAALLFASFDTNADYRTSTDEFEVGITAAFKVADADNSGTVSLLEYQDWAARALGNRSALPGWLTVDRDGNSGIEMSEFRLAFAELAGNYGLTTPNGIELSALAQDLETLINTMKSQRPQGGMMRPGGMGGGGMPTGPRAGQPLPLIIRLRGFERSTGSSRTCVADAAIHTSPHR